MARPSTPPQGILNLRCHEYCDGTEAVFYCPQCSAIFCDSCYDREHEGSVRKQTHERLVEVKPICKEHQHTLEYFDLTCLKPICITCLTNLQSKGEIQSHVIEKIDDVSTKLCSLLDEKVVESKEILNSIQKAAQNTLETTKRTLNMAKKEVHHMIEQGKRILNEREQRINRQINKVQTKFLGSEESTTGLIGLASHLEDNIQQAERVSDEGKFSAHFPYLFNKLNDLCATARNHLDNPKGLKVTVTLAKVAVAKIMSLVDIEAEVVKPEEIPDNEGEDGTSSNCVRVVIMSDSSCSPANITTHPITVRTLAGMDQSDSQDHQLQNEPVENTMEMSPERSKPLTPRVHGNQSEELESPGNHSNQTEEQESPDLYGNLEQEDVGSPGSHSNQTEELESPDLYGNLEQEDVGSPGSHSNQSEEQESPDLYGNLQQEDIESSGIHSNQSEEIKSPDLCYEQVEGFGSPGVHGNLFENIHSHRIHGDLTPKNYSIHGDQAEDPESPIVHETVRNRMAESACIHGNNHVTKRVSKIHRTSKQVGMNSTLTKSKRGRKRKKRPSDDEWTPTRILRSSTMERRKGETVAKPRSRRGGELSQEMNRCDAILTILWADEDSWPFVHLVHKKQCPEYYKKISNPVSLDIIKQTLHSYQYRSVLDFVRDFNQMIKNCHVFNKPDSDVHQAATRLALRFNNLLRECFPNIESVFQDQELMDSSL